MSRKVGAVFDNNAKEVVSRTLKSHLDKFADWLRKPGFPQALYPAIRAILEHENAKIMEGIDVVHEGGVQPLFGFRAEEEGIATYVSILPGESWEDIRRFMRVCQITMENRTFLGLPGNWRQVIKL